MTALLSIREAALELHLSEDECPGCHENENPTKEAKGALGQIQKRSGIRMRLLAQAPRGGGQIPLFNEKEAA